MTMSDPSLDPADEDNYEGDDHDEFQPYEEPSDEPMWEPNEFYTDPMYGSDTF